MGGQDPRLTVLEPRPKLEKAMSWEGTMPTTAAAGFPRPRASAGTAPVRGLLLAAVPVAGAAFALGAPAAAHPLYDTKRVLRHTENECLTLPRNECRTVRSPLVPLDAGGVTNVELACEPEFPYVVGWDAEHHEHISLALASARPDRSAAGAAPPAAAAAVEPESVTVHAANHADARGFVTLFLGCAAEPVAGAPFLLSKHSLPTNALRRLVKGDQDDKDDRR
jgi:hypothetical protein